MVPPVPTPDTRMSTCAVGVVPDLRARGRLVDAGLAGFLNCCNSTYRPGSEAAISSALAMAPGMPLGPSVRTSFAPSATSSLRRSMLIVSGMVSVERVAAGGGDEGQGDAGVAAGGLDELLAGAEDASLETSRAADHVRRVLPALARERHRRRAPRAGGAGRRRTCVDGDAGVRDQDVDSAVALDDASIAASAAPLSATSKPDKSAFPPPVVIASTTARAASSPLR